MDRDEGDGAEVISGTSFMFVLDTQARIESVNQSPALGVDEEGDSIVREKVYRRAKGHEVVTKGQRGTLVRKVTMLLMGRETKECILKQRP